MGPSSNRPDVLIRREKRESSPSRRTKERPGKHTAGRRLGGCLHPSGWRGAVGGVLGEVGGGLGSHQNAARLEP